MGSLSRSTANNDRLGSAPPLGTLAVSRDGDGLVLAAHGAWVIGAARELDRALRGIEAMGARSAVFDLSGISALDTAGAWLLLRTRKALSGGGRTVELRDLG